MAVGTERSRADFEALIAEVEPPLRRALCAAYGLERGREATAEAVAWAWEHRDRLAEVRQPVPFLYRVGQSRIRRRLVRVPFVRAEHHDPHVEPALAAALRALSRRQRVAVVLVHAYDWTAPEVADLLGISSSSVETHLRRGLRHLRRELHHVDEEES